MTSRHVRLARIAGIPISLNDAWSAFLTMDREGVNQLLVVEDGAITGVLSREDLVSFLQRIHLTGV